MNLFDIIPGNYFSIFVGKNKRIFAESLLILYSLFENHTNLISKNDFIRSLKDREDELSEFDFSEEDDDDEEPEGEDDFVEQKNTVQYKANAICRRLEETGWIEVTLDPSTNDESVILPAYTVSFIKAIREAMTEEESSYISLVHATYSELKLEDEQLDDFLYDTLKRTYDHANDLKRDLNILSNQIYIYQNRLGKLYDANSVLHDHFDLYKRRVIDRYYHPLKTIDSVAKFRRSIIRILERWLRDDEIRGKLVEQGSHKMPDKTIDQVEREIIAMINYVCDSLELINSEIDDIDVKHSEYIKSSTGKIQYLNNNDKTIRGHLENILKTYAENVKRPRTLGRILTIIQNGCFFYEHGFIDATSVTLPIVRKFKYDSTPLEIPDFGDIAADVLNSFIRETENVYSDDDVFKFMQLAFGSLNELPITKIPIKEFEALIYVILATIRKDDEKCFYIVETVDKSTVRNGNFLVPNLLYIRKEHFEYEENVNLDDEDTDIDTFLENKRNRSYVELESTEEFLEREELESHLEDEEFEEEGVVFDDVEETETTQDIEPTEEADLISEEAEIEEAESEYQLEASKEEKEETEIEEQLEASEEVEEFNAAEETESSEELELTEQEEEVESDEEYEASEEVESDEQLESYEEKVEETESYDEEQLELSEETTDEFESNEEEEELETSSQEDETELELEFDSTEETESNEQLEPYEEETEESELELDSSEKKSEEQFDSYEEEEVEDADSNEEETEEELELSEETYDEYESTEGEEPLELSEESDEEYESYEEEAEESEVELDSSEEESEEQFDSYEEEEVEEVDSYEEESEESLDLSEETSDEYESYEDEESLELSEESNDEYESYEEDTVDSNYEDVDTDETETNEEFDEYEQEDEYKGDD